MTLQPPSPPHPMTLYAGAVTAVVARVSRNHPEASDTTETAHKKVRYRSRKRIIDRNAFDGGVALTATNRLRYGITPVSDVTLFVCGFVSRCMSPNNSPYVFREEVEDDVDEADERSTTQGQEVVIVDGQAMSYRWYRR